MKFVLEINTDNDAFVGEGGEAGRHEIARILHEAAERVEEGYTGGPVRDINGNKVGFFTTMDDEGHRL